MPKRVYVLEKIERKSAMSPNEHHYDVSFFYNNDLTYGRISFVVSVDLLERVKPLMTQDEMDEIFND
jgi:hypothetical protein